MVRYIEELVSQQVQKSIMAHKKELVNGIKCTTPIVTISRRMGSGAKIIAAKLSEVTGWSMWGRELIDEIAQDAKVSRKVVEAFDEKTISEITLLVQSVLGNTEMGSFLYGKHLTHAVAALSKLGNVIMIGRGSNFIIQNALHVRIDASDEVRIQNMMKFENMERNEAEHKLKESDIERHLFLEKMFGKERVHKFNYDLTINMDNFTNDDAVAIILRAMERKCGVLEKIKTTI
jgi:cytidylate kinase